MNLPRQSESRPARWWPLRKRQNFLITTLVLFELLVGPSIVKMHTDHGVLVFTALLLALAIPAIGGNGAGFSLWPLFRRDQRP